MDDTEFEDLINARYERLREEKKPQPEERPVTPGDVFAKRMQHFLGAGESVLKFSTPTYDPRTSSQKFADFFEEAFPREHNLLDDFIDEINPDNKKGA